MIKILILSGLAAALGGAGWMIVTATADHEYIWAAGAGVFALAFLAACIGMLRGNKTAYRAGRVIAFVPLGLGLYLMHFAWNFHLWKEPTLPERVASAFSPPQVLFTVLPLTWILLMSGRRVRGHFNR